MFNGNLVRIKVKEDVRNKFTELCVYAGKNKLDIYNLVFSKVEDMFESATSNKVDEVGNFYDVMDFNRVMKGESFIVFDLENNTDKYIEMQEHVAIRCSPSDVKEVMHGFIIKAVITLYWKFYKENKVEEDRFETFCNSVIEVAKRCLKEYKTINVPRPFDGPIKEYIIIQTVKALRFFIDLYERDSKK